MVDFILAHQLLPNNESVCNHSKLNASTQNIVRGKRCVTQFPVLLFLVRLLVPPFYNVRRMFTLYASVLQSQSYIAAAEVAGTIAGPVEYSWMLFGWLLAGKGVIHYYDRVLMSLVYC